MKDIREKYTPLRTILKGEFLQNILRKSRDLLAPEGGILFSRNSHFPRIPEIVVLSPRFHLSLSGALSI